MTTRNLWKELGALSVTCTVRLHVDVKSLNFTRLRTSCYFACLAASESHLNMGDRRPPRSDNLEPFSSDWNDEQLFEAILSALMRPQFEPRRRNGSLRRYRFPKQKASRHRESTSVGAQSRSA